MKVDLLDVNAVRGGLGVAELMEDSLGQFVLARSQTAFIDDGFDMVQMPVNVFMRRFHDRVGRPKATALHGLEGQLAGQAKTRHGRLDRAGVDTAVDERAQGHVAGDSAKALEVANPHRAFPFSTERFPEAHSSCLTLVQAILTDAT